MIALLRERIDFERLSAIQFCPRGLIRITFKNVSDKEEFARMGSLALDGHDLSVTSSDEPPSLVYVHYFPAEGDDVLICDELSKYGKIVSIKHQSFSGIPGLLTGSRILTMVLSDPVPAEFRIDDHPVKTVRQCLAIGNVSRKTMRANKTEVMFTDIWSLSSQVISFTYDMEP